VVIWFAYHAPVIFVPGVYSNPGIPTWASLLLFAIAITGFSFFVGALWEKHHDVWGATFAHGVPQMIVAALGLWAVLAWRTHAWVTRRLAGAALGSMIARSLGEGAIVGALIGAGAYALAVAQDGTPVVDLFIFLTMSVWAVLGAGVFFVLAVTVGLIVRARPMEIRSGRAE
jgi:hypothetical protein